MRFSHAILIALTFASLINVRATADTYYQTNLVSDGFVAANTIDKNMINPWGLSFSGTSPFWVSNQGTGTSTLYNGAGVANALVVTVPGGASTSAGPTGQVFNSTADFIFPGTSQTKASFLFANLNGQISGWNGSKVSTAEVVIDRSTAGAVYTGLALGTSSVGSTLYAADNAHNRIDVFNGSFGTASLSGAFADPTLNSDFTAFNIQNIGNKLYVTYQSKTNAGGGAVDVYDLNGNLLKSLISNGAGGHLDSPWGIAIAPSTFGTFANALLVANEDQGIINGFDVNTGAFLGTLSSFDNQPIVNTGLWALAFGNGGNGGDKNKLYFTAGLDGEVHGLLGSITVPEPSSVILMGLGISSVLVLGRRFGRN